MRKAISRWLTTKRPFKTATQGRSSVPAGTRIYAVGDIHGRVDLLDKMLARIDENLASSPVKHPILVFIGDYVDRGPDSRKVVDRLIARSKTNEVVCLKGNHEAFMLDFLDDPAALDQWRQFGGLPTLMSYGLTPPSRLESDGYEELAVALRAKMPPGHRSFLDNLRLSFTCGDYFFVHAGVRPGVRLANQKEEDLLWIRDEFLHSKQDFGKVVVHGHTPIERPDVRKNRINIDTGAFATGNLTCLVIEGEEIAFL